MDLLVLIGKFSDHLLQPEDGKINEEHYKKPEKKQDIIIDPFSK